MISSTACRKKNDRIIAVKVTTKRDLSNRFFISLGFKFSIADEN